MGLPAEMCVKMCEISNNFAHAYACTHASGKKVCDVQAGMTENNFRPTILNGFLICIENQNIGKFQVN